MASDVYNSFLGRLMGDISHVATAINLATDTIKLSLHTSSYTPDVNAATGDVFFEDVDNEISTTVTYTAGIAGGYTLIIVTTAGVQTDDTDDEGVLDFTDVSITSATITARYAIVRKDTGVASTSPVLFYIDFGSNQTSTAGTFTIAFAAEGVLNIATA